MHRRVYIQSCTDAYMTCDRIFDVRVSLYTMPRAVAPKRTTYTEGKLVYFTRDQLRVIEAAAKADNVTSTTLVRDAALRRAAEINDGVEVERKAKAQQVAEDRRILKTPPSEGLGLRSRPPRDLPSSSPPTFAAPPQPPPTVIVQQQPAASNALPPDDDAFLDRLVAYVLDAPAGLGQVKRLNEAVAMIASSTAGQEERERLAAVLDGKIEKGRLARGLSVHDAVVEPPASPFAWLKKRLVGDGTPSQG